MCGRTEWPVKWKPLMGEPHPFLCHTDAKIVPAPETRPRSLFAQGPTPDWAAAVLPPPTPWNPTHILSRSQVKKVLGARTAHSEAQNLPRYPKSRASSSLPELPCQPHSMDSFADVLGKPPLPATWARVHDDPLSCIRELGKEAITNTAEGHACWGLHTHLLPGHL